SAPSYGPSGRRLILPPDGASLMLRGRRSGMTDDPAIAARLVERVSQQTAAVRFREPMATVDVGALMDRAMGALGARLGEAAISPAGPPYARYHDWGGEWADVEIGFPLADRLSGPA